MPRRGHSHLFCQSLRGHSLCGLLHHAFAKQAIELGLEGVRCRLIRQALIGQVNSLLPGETGLQLALLHCLQHLNGDHLARVLQVAPKPILPGVEWVSVLNLKATLEPLSTSV